MEVQSVLNAEVAAVLSGRAYVFSDLISALEYGEDEISPDSYIARFLQGRQVNAVKV